MKRHPLLYICVFFLLLSWVFGSRLLDIDEFSFVKEPYEMLGGDYTAGYLKEGNTSDALKCAAKSYFFYWNYRPLFSPVIKEKHKTLFRKEEERFHYEKPPKTEEKRLDDYSQRLVVPEPDRFYQHGAGKPLLPAILSIPSLALVKALTSRGPDLLHYQFTTNYHPLFIIVRLPSIIAGLLCILLIYRIVKREFSEERAWIAAGLMACFPTSLMFFSNIHHDAILAPFALAASYYLVKKRYLIAGVFFGLALASKNTAVFVLAGAILYLAIEAIQVYRNGNRGELGVFLTRATRGLVLFAIIGIVVLSPFANPVSEIKEILTPVTGRTFDTRGEDVSDFGLAGPVIRQEKGDKVRQERPVVSTLKRVVGYNASLIFLLIGLPLIIERLRSPMAKYSFCFLMFSFPYRLVFGSGLNYRFLMFVPFFVLLASMVLGRRALLVILLLLVVIDLIFVVDPITATGSWYTLANDKSLIQTLMGGTR
ncbi:MAG: glycosyltransferase family 39 protein [Candidatus Latescibacterota bacterium]|nr:MAG: glycosyltransferase family 39 protein [Candidatus Latescibacterota bacterium]